MSVQTLFFNRFTECDFCSIATFLLFPVVHQIVVVTVAGLLIKSKSASYYTIIPHPEYLPYTSTRPQIRRPERNYLLFPRLGSQSVINFAGTYILSMTVIFLFRPIATAAYSAQSLVLVLFSGKFQ